MRSIKFEMFDMPSFEMFDMPSIDWVVLLVVARSKATKP